MRRFFVLTIVVAIVLGSVTLVYAAGDAFTQGEKFITDVQKWIITVSTPLALIGVGSGAIMKKLSFGDVQKIKMGSAVIFASLGGWTLINGLTLILSTIQKYL